MGPSKRVDCNFKMFVWTKKEQTVLPVGYVSCVGWKKYFEWHMKYVCTVYNHPNRLLPDFVFFEIVPPHRYIYFD